MSPRVIFIGRTYLTTRAGCNYELDLDPILFRLEFLALNMYYIRLHNRFLSDTLSIVVWQYELTTCVSPTSTMTIQQTPPLQFSGIL
jgi:hypothetical protein